MRILLIASSYNSLTQRTHVELAYRDHEVSIELALSDAILVEAVELYRPDLIIAPMMKQRIPENIWRDHVCIVVHPGIKGDRGPSSLDWAILNEEKEWGVTTIQAIAEIDAGDIWSSVTFKMRQASKSSLYRNEVTQAAIKAILQTVERFESKTFIPTTLDYNQEDVKGCLRPYMKQKIRAIDWSEPVSSILKKIWSADSQPGVLDNIYGEEYYLYDAHEEDTLKGYPGEIIAQRNGAICRAAADGAVWISHLKKKGKQASIKLPATMVLGEYLNDVPESPLPLQVPTERKTYKEIWYEEKNQVGYLHFEFYNGAMSTEQCQRLRQAFLYACKQPTKVIVLMGGHDFWSNGIHLNVIEAAKHPADESWQNIIAMDDLVQSIITTNTHLVIAAMQGNAAAGGVILALASDYVYARRGIVLNPHYKRMNLYGSEYWTYLLPKRVGYQKALELTSNCMPMSSQVATEIGLIDKDFGKDNISFCQKIMKIAEEVAHSSDYQQKLDTKIQKRLLDEEIKPLELYRKEELENMKINFYGSDPIYHMARRNFVYKVTPSETPLHLAKHRQSNQNEVNCVVI
jgi:putative two-component system protein, hydrogenase maturation factor HypX/HoxX